MAGRDTFIVTGAAQGLGEKTMNALAARGASVLGVDLDGPLLEQSAARARALGGRIETFAADVSDAAAVQAFVARAKAAFGKLDGIFNNAAIAGPQAFIVDYAQEDFERVNRINVGGVFLGMKHAIPLLLENEDGGSIVNTASTGGMMGWPKICGYIASKHAVIGLTRTVALEYAGKKIRANAVSPGPMATEMMLSTAEELMAPGDRAKARKLLDATIPIGRLGEPEEIASMVVYLLMDAPEYLTGAVIPVDGAQTAG